MKWRNAPIRAIGALAISYHEMFRGRRTAVCMDCGRLTHANADRCMCGGETEENEHPEDVLDDPDAGTADSLDRPLFRYGIPVAKVAAGVGAVQLVFQASVAGDPAGTLGAAVVFALAVRWL